MQNEDGGEAFGPCVSFASEVEETAQEYHDDQKNAEERCQIKPWKYEAELEVGGRQEDLGRRTSTRASRRDRLRGVVVVRSQHDQIDEVPHGLVETDQRIYAKQPLHWLALR